MKVVVMNTSDTEGGAARCAHRLHRGLREAGVDSTYFVQKKVGSDADAVTSTAWHRQLSAELRPGIDRVPMRVYKKRRRAPFSTGLMIPVDLEPLVTAQPDIVNLHYVGEGFLPIRSLARIRKPIVWTLHDSWPFTGGCHLPGECTAYEGACGRCPILGSTSERDLTYWIQRHKAQEWHHLDITIVTDSRWLADCARRSALFRTRRIEPINPGLTLETYAPVDRSIARTILNLPLHKKLVLFGAMHSTTDPNKGFQFLHPAIRRLAQSVRGQDTEVVIFGATRPQPEPDFGMPSHYVGRLHDDVSLAVLYSAADVMIVPSIRESFGQTASESMACGTPVVSFGATGLLDIVEHLRNGYLAEPYDPVKLAEGIDWVLSRDLDEARQLSKNARETAMARFSIERMTSRYVELFGDLLSRSEPSRSAESIGRRT